MYNFTFAHFFEGIIAAAVGALMLKYNFQLVNMAGRQDWIEKYTGSGSTFFIFKLLALLVVAGGLIFAGGFGNNVMNWLFSPLRGLFTL